MIIIKTKVISGVISALLITLNINPLLSKALESGSGINSNTISICTTTAISYLRTTQNSNGSWRNCIQNTAEIAQIFDLCCDTNEKLETQNKALLYYENQSSLNVDLLSNELLLSSSIESWKVNYLKNFQNHDGGFGYQQGLSSNAYLSADIANILIDTVDVNPVLSYYLEDTFTALDSYLDTTFPALNELSASDLDTASILLCTG